MEPVLMNGGDSITLKVLVSGTANRVKVDGRIIGVSNIDKVRNGSYRVSNKAVLSLGLFILASLGFFIMMLKSPDLANVGIVIFGTAAIWLIGRPESLRRWGYICGALTQPFWIYLAIKYQMWGVLLHHCVIHVLHGVRAFGFIG